MAEINSKQISVMIAGRSYPLKVKESDEEIILSIAEEVNKRIREYQEVYANREKQDWLAMAILSLAIEKHQNDKKFADAKIIQRLNELEKNLDDLL